MVCFECGASDSIHEHHVVPRSLGGTKTLPLCENCHSMVHEKNLKISNLIKIGLEKRRAAGEPLGRPRGISYEEAIAAIEGGLSYRQAATLLGCSVGSIQNAVKVKRSKAAASDDEGL